MATAWQKGLRRGAPKGKPKFRIIDVRPAVFTGGTHGTEVTVDLGSGGVHVAKVWPDGYVSGLHKFERDELDKIRTAATQVSKRDPARRHHRRDPDRTLNMRTEHRARMLAGLLHMGHHKATVAGTTVRTDAPSRELEEMVAVVDGSTRVPPPVRRVVHGRASRLGRDLARRDADAGSEGFVRDVERQLRIGDRHISFKTKFSLGRNDSVYMNYVNLPKDLGSHGGAEAENNRLSVWVKGFSTDPNAPPPRGKVTLETANSSLHRGEGYTRENRVTIRGRTGTPAQIARYLADSLNKIAAEVPPRFTHSAPRDPRRARRFTPKRRR